MNERMLSALNGAEPATYAALRRHGYAVQQYGQAMLTDQARQMLRGVPTPERWTPDFLVTRPEIVDRPRWPDATRGKYAFFVDSKYAPPRTGNHSLEMRSLLAGGSFGLDVFYVCSIRRGDEYGDFGVIGHAHLSPGRYRPCCPGCLHTFTTDPDPMRALPQYCPSQRKTHSASGTPYFVLPGKDLHPLSSFVFDILRPDRSKENA